MTKSDYLSNSAKLLMISSILLLVTNALVYLGGDGTAVAGIGQKMSNISFYAVLIMGFLAFNGEGIGYKRSRDFTKKKRTSVLKAFLVFAFLFRYIKTPVEHEILSIEADSAAGIGARFLLSGVNTIASYGFILTLVSLWFLVRDVNIRALFTIESISFLCGVIYNSYKLLNYTVTKYGVAFPGELFIDVFSSQRVLQALCLVQFFVNGLMCLFVMRYYGKLALAEQEEQKKSKKRAMPARRIYNTDCVGIDTLDDDYSV